MTLNQAFFDGLPFGAALVTDQRIALMNNQMLDWFPEMEPGSSASAEVLSLVCGEAKGSITIGGKSCTLSTMTTQEGMLLFLYEDANHILALERLDHTIYQLRNQIHDIMLNSQMLSAQLTGDEGGYLARINRRMFQMMRLVNNFDLLYNMNVTYTYIGIDMVGLCSQLIAQAELLLAQANLKLDYSSDCTSLLVPGNHLLLRRAVLGLISNSAHTCKEGTVYLHLKRMGQRAIMIVSDTGHLSDHRQLISILSGEGTKPIPKPGQGAGLGYPVIRKIVELHDGSLFLRQADTGGLETIISLPTQNTPLSMTVSSPDRNSTDIYGGFSGSLVELSDILPTSLFTQDNIENLI